MPREHLSLEGERLVTVVPPEGLIYRVARGLDPFELPDWPYTGANRFDDPRTEEEAPGQRFRVLYCATERVGAYGETLGLNIEIIDGRCLW